ncbi:MAG: DUF1003 domain-containing protein [Microgenomates group bacterium]
MPKNHTKRTHRIIQSFEAKALKKRPLSVKIADALTSYFGTLGFLIFNLALFTFWILANNGRFSGIPIFDPYPHVLLITAVSLEAIILAIVVLISQNRENHINSLRDELQLQVDLIAEKEITKILLLLNELLKKEGIKITDAELTEMLKEIDTSYIERKLEDQIGKESSSIAQKVADPLVKVGEKVGKSFSSKK